MIALEAIAIIVGVVSGVSGLVLGILNYLHQRDTARPRVRVYPWVRQDDGSPACEPSGIMIIKNVGHVPVIGSTMGFLRTRVSTKDITFCGSQLVHGVDWTQELKPQHVTVLQFELGALPEGPGLGPPFAKTKVGDIFKASRRQMRKFAKKRKALSQPPSAAPGT